MVRGRLRLVSDRSGAQDGDDLRRRFAEIRERLAVPASFPAPVLAEAQDAARRPPSPGVDLREVPFVTIDPPGSTDLDQALHIRRVASGYAVDYAIADVPGFVAADGAVAAESLVRGQTLYSPDLRTPLHPSVLSEDAASLLPDQDRPAIVWRFGLDESGEVRDVGVVAAFVRSRRRLDYADVQARADRHATTDPGESGDLGDVQAVLLREVGVRRQALEQARGGASLPLPDQEVEARGTGYAVRLRPGLPSEDWNAQISLMTGMAAARIMLGGGVGVLRTMPAPDPGAMARYRRQTRALGTSWQEPETYGDYLRRLDRGRPQHLALLHEAAALFRGAGYTPFDGAAPAQGTHAAVAAPYAHVTAPLRRLVDRFGLVCCLALAGGRPVPAWVRDGLWSLPEAMQASDRTARELERRCVDVVEAAVLAPRVGGTFEAVVVDVGKDGGGGGGEVQVLDPPVLARCEGPLRLGDALPVRLVAADPGDGELRFAPA